MNIALQPDEKVLRASIEEKLRKIRRHFHEQYLGGKELANLVHDMGLEANKLHNSLKHRGHEPRHHQYMIVNRGMSPNNPQFYMHVHPVEDLLKYIENPHANDDPADQTIDAEFKFRIFCRLRNHEDTYRMVRTRDGWHVSHISINGPCDKGGNPFLFANFRQDSIAYPSGLDGWLEWLWIQAAEKGLTEQQVQEALQELANWVSETEKRAPSGGVWEGY